MQKPQYLFLTGRLAENALRETLKSLAKQVDFGYSIQVLPISVAALMTPDWIAKKISVPKDCQRIIVPGHCQGDLQVLTDQFGITFERGPKDLRKLPQYLGQKRQPPLLNDYSIEIIAEINHAPRYTIQQVVQHAESLIQDGADFIDVGCIPGETFHRIGEYVRAVKGLGVKVSIDSLNIKEIEIAADAGADLVLSVNQSNRHAAADWGCEVVIIPDEISDIESMSETIELMEKNNVRFRIDPILEPIGLGFAESLNRYHQSRQRWPKLEMMMGIGNLTELTDVDSAGVNLLLLGFCEELKIKSVLTTQVINWARSSVKECDVARRLVHYACDNGVPPKNLSGQLVSLRDERLLEYSDIQLQDLASQIKDHNYRIFADNESLHLLGSEMIFSEKDPFKIFDELAATNPKNLDASHSFYLGYELCKAMIAMQLGKNYVQDEALDWGHLTEKETNRHRLSKRFRKHE